MVRKGTKIRYFRKKVEFKREDHDLRHGDFKWLIDTWREKRSKIIYRSPSQSSI